MERFEVYLRAGADGLVCGIGAAAALFLVGKVLFG